MENHDPLGRLDTITTSTSATKFQYDGANISTELDGSGTILRRYVYGDAADEPLVWYEGSDFSNKRYLASDERGSVIAVTDGGGNPLAINSYDEYGIPGLYNIGRFQYTGQAWIPELGMYSYKARVYSPTLGRFMQTDPAGYPDGPNWYAYTNNDPVNKTDPSGLGSCVNGDCTWITNGDGGGAGYYPYSGFLEYFKGNMLDFDIFLDQGDKHHASAITPQMPQNNQPPPCPKGGRVTLSAQASATGAFLYLIGSVSGEFGISIPTDFFKTGSLRGTQLFVSGGLSGLGGLGFFAAAGAGPSAGYSNGPIQSGFGGQHVAGAGAALGAGGEVSVATDGSGGSISGGPRGGVGAYAGYGGKVSGTAATPQIGCSP